MEFAFTFFKAAVHCRTRTRGGLARINWLARFGLAGWRRRLQTGAAAWSTTWTKAWRTAGHHGSSLRATLRKS
jgi:hypothetical protein